MTTQLSNCLAALAAIGLLAACTPEASEAQGDRRVAAQERPVDWDKAQKDAPPASVAIASPRGAFDTEVQNAAVGAPVPMLAPPTTVSVAAGLDDDEATVRVTKDGYFATFPGPRYDVTVHGTKAFYVAPSGAPPAQAAAKTPTKADDVDYRFELGEGEAQVTFRRYGADYLITFACKTGPTDAACISQADALAFAQRLQLVNP
jgi:hypothetical protein